MTTNLSKYVPHIWKSDFDSEATAFLEAYYKPAIEKPMCVPIEMIAKDVLHLTIKEIRMTEDLSILGQMCFTPGKVEIYDKAEDEYREIVVEAGTMILDPDTEALRNIGSKRNTIAHECFHWHRHRPYHLAAAEATQDKSAYRCPVNLKDEKFKDEWTDEDWMEWQANGIAPRILMPIETIEATFENLRKKSLQNPFVAKGLRPQSEWILEQFAGFYKVSKISALIRLTELGYLS